MGINRLSIQFDLHDSLLLLTCDVVLAWLMLPNGYVSEQSWGGKKEMIVS
ncbi:hypothetical protein ACK34X_13505 [Aeromonas veronii]